MCRGVSRYSGHRREGADLICAPETYARIRAETKTYAADMFGFARYVTRIGQIALSACSAADSSESAAVKSIAGVSR